MFFLLYMAKTSKKTNKNFFVVTVKKINMLNNLFLQNFHKHKSNGFYMNAFFICS